MTHSLLIIIPLSFRPTQSPLLGYLMVVWGRGTGYYKAGAFVLRLAGGIPLICSDYYRVHPHTPPPLFALTDSIHTQQCAVSVPGRISALHREERISHSHSAHLHTCSQRTTWAPKAAPLLYKSWHSYHRVSTSSTLTAVRRFKRDHSCCLFCFFFLLDSFEWSKDLFISFKKAMSLFNWQNESSIIWRISSLNIKEFIPIFFSWGCFFFFIHFFAPECHLESPMRFARKRSLWCKRPSVRPIRRIFWPQPWGWGWGHKNLQPLFGSHLNCSPIRSSPHWFAELHWRRATGPPDLRKPTTLRWAWVNLKNACQLLHLLV